MLSRNSLVQNGRRLSLLWGEAFNGPVWIFTERNDSCSPLYLLPRQCDGAQDSDVGLWCQVLCSVVVQVSVDHIFSFCCATSK